MTTVSIEVEVVSSFPADNVFKVFSKFFDVIAPKVNPQIFKSIETINGDGGVGTVKHFTFGDGLPFTSGKQKVDVIDESNYIYGYTFFEGDNLMGILDSVTHHVKITPSANGGSVFKQTVTYNCKGDEKPSQETLNFEKEIYEKTFKAIEAHVAANPGAY